MKKNALYIHGFMGNPEGGTFKTLQKTLKNWNIHSISFQTYIQMLKKHSVLSVHTVNPKKLTC